MDSSFTSSSFSSAEVAEQYLGNINENRELASEIALDKKHGRCLDVSIDRQSSQKGRILVQAQSGQPVGIVKGRNWVLRSGDVMMTRSPQRVLIQLTTQQVIALQIDPKAYNSPVRQMNLGHVMGNQHWPMTMVDETLYVEITDDADRIESTLREIVEA